MSPFETLISTLRQVLGTTSERSVPCEDTEALLRLADAHDLSHLVGHVLGSQGALGDDVFSKELCATAKRSVLRHHLFDRELQKICHVFDKENIPYVPLKGAVLRQLYPEPWMRTSCDLDILVQESHLDIAVDALCTHCAFTHGVKSHHDVTMHSPNGISVELHFTLETECGLQEQTILQNVWDYTSPGETPGSCYHLSDEFLYFYHIAHIAKHLRHGGCGIRFFLDLWLLNHRISFDPQKRIALLEQGGLLQLANALENLSESWFSGKEMDALSVNLEHYILSGGNFGSFQNSVAAEQNRQGGKLRFLCRKVFPPYTQMVYYYPALRKYPWLLPVYTLRRWCRLLFTKDARRAMQTIKTNASMSEEALTSVAYLMHELGLSR